MTLNNGVVTYPSGTTFPSQAIFDCDSGYYLNATGSRLSDCLNTASWKWPKTPAECEGELDFRVDIRRDKQFPLRQECDMTQKKDTLQALHEHLESFWFH